MMLIKICGLTSVEDALQAARAGADMVGLIFAPSRHRVSTEKATEIAAAIKKPLKRPAVVGVFVNENPEIVNMTVANCGLDMVQLSGDENRDYCSHMIRPLIKVIHIAPGTGAGEVLENIGKYREMDLKQPFICMLDSGAKGKYGGTGLTFDWSVAAQVCEAFPVMVAGGLCADNVKALLSRAKPLGVDVSSGVETDGRKDYSKISEFVQQVRATGY